MAESIEAVADQIAEQFFMKEDSKYNTLVNELSRTIPLNKAKDEAWRILGTEMVEEVLEAMGAGLTYGTVTNTKRIFGR